MEQRVLGRSGIHTSALGFGCASLLGPRSTADALNLLEAAYDLGVTHFDVARSYASGEAESVVGTFLSSHDRAAVTVTTKFGIEPSPLVTQWGTARRLARKAMRASPAIRRALGRRAARMVKRNAFGVDEARRSLDTSLQRLRTDYVDVLLLHDPTPSDLTPELLAFLEEARANGKIRAYGAGTDVQSAAALRVGWFSDDSILQFPHSVLEPAVRIVDAPISITHGSMARMGVTDRLLRSPAAQSRWEDALGLSFSRGQLAALSLAWSVATNRRGPVLVATTSREHLVSNVAAVDRYPDETVRSFQDVMLQLYRR
jgi:D-threo-aldose 1-dehydrogenase